MNAYENNDKKLDKSISPAGFLIMGLSCVFGSSWLLLSNTWLIAGKTPTNVIIAFIIGVLLILTVSMSYKQIFQIIPNGNGEITYAERAFGKKSAAIIGWCGFLVNTILCSWQSIAITNVLSYIFPFIKDSAVLYSVGGLPVTAYSILIGLIIILFSMIVNLNGTKSSIKAQSAITSTVFIFLFLSLFISLFNLKVENLAYTSTSASHKDIISVLVILPFSIAGWENIAKGAQEAKKSVTSKNIWLSMLIAIALGGAMYLIMFIAQIGIVPPSEFLSYDIPFIIGLNNVTGSNIFGNLILFTACLNIINVYNGMFFGASRAIYSLSALGYIPKVFSKISKTKQTPYMAIIFVSVLISLAPFFGQFAFTPLVNISSLIYIILWGSTVVANITIKKKENIIQTRCEKIQSAFGCMIIIFLLGAMLLPISPGALKWPLEYVLAAILISLGILLYKLRGDN